MIYPWYVLWLLPFAFGRGARPAWIWTLSVLTIYPVWQLHRLGGPFEVPAALSAVTPPAHSSRRQIPVNGK